MAERPSLVTIIAFLVFLAALTVLFAGVVCATMSESIWEDVLQELIDSGADVDGLTLDLMHNVGYIMVVASIVSFVIGYALWKGWTIAWYLAVILFIAGAILALYSAITISYVSAIGLAIVVILIYYMFRPKVKEFFKV